MFNKKIISLSLAALLSGMVLSGCGTVDSGTEASAAKIDSADSLVESYSQTKEKKEEIKFKLSNPNADKTTQQVYQYIASLTNNGVLSGQQESTWMGSVDYEMDYIYDKTGKYPALRGLDYMNDDFKGVNERAEKWWNEGGLVTICWHTGYDFNGEWNEAMKTEVKDWDKVLTEGTAEYDAFVKGMDKAAEALLELQKKGVTVLWRPFHEFDGAWFWWGKGGSDNFVKLWQLMYDRYTNHWGLNNLIWVLGYSGNGNNYESWYPGDEYCDIVGADSYNGGAQGKLAEKITKFVGGSKPLCFHECGTNPTEAELKEVPWTWFMTWHTDHIVNQNDPDKLKTLYNSSYVITKDELPSFTKTKK